MAVIFFSCCVDYWDMVNMKTPYIFTPLFAHILWQIVATKAKSID